jgi:hypothetical protein
VALAVMVALAAPWWLTVLAHHGLQPFYAASLTGEWTSLSDQFSMLEHFFAGSRLVVSVLGASAILGVIVCLCRGELFLPLWLVVVFLLTPRSALTEGTLPLALLAGIGLTEVVVPGLRVAAAAYPPLSLWAKTVSAVRTATRRPAVSPVLRASAMCLLLSGVFTFWPSLSLDEKTLEPLPAADRVAMHWVDASTPSDGQYLVLSSTWSWEADPAGEWFPVLANRRSLLTPQGAEWLPGRLHARLVCLFGTVRELGAQGKGVNDLDRWAGDRGIRFAGVYISKAHSGPIDWSALISSAQRSPAYTVLMDTPDVTVLRRAAPVESRWPSADFTIASDCQALGDQSEQTQQAFEATYGSSAAEMWAAQHDALIGSQSPALSVRSALRTLASRL